MIICSYRPSVLQSFHLTFGKRAVPSRRAVHEIINTTEAICWGLPESLWTLHTPHSLSRLRSGRPGQTCPALRELSEKQQGMSHHKCVELVGKYCATCSVPVQ